MDNSKKKLNNTFKLAVKPLLILIMAAYLVTASHVIVPSLDYLLNRDYISEVLCENADNPELGCNGKCHLGKMMAHAGHGHKHDSQPVDIKRPFDLRLLATKSPNGRYLLDFDEVTYRTTISMPAIKLLPTDIFHPPEA
jgi:hypothetical protein